MVATYSAPNTEVRDLPIDDVHPSELNPRKAFDAEALAELAESIRQHGVLQPIVVRPATVTLEDGLAVAGWLIVAGERRWRASKLAGVETVPAVVREGLTDADHLRLALIENLARRDLDPIEEAEGYRQLHRVVGLKQSEIAAAVNRSQPAIANAMRLLELPEDVQAQIRRRELSVAHGVALAKWAAWPALCSWLAGYAIQQGMTSKLLEKWSPEKEGYSIPDSVARRVSEYTTPFHKTCLECPFSAYRKGSYTSVCLRPEHYAELEAARQAAQEAARQQAIAAATAGGAQLRSLEEFPQARVLDRHSTPAGCSAGCACRLTVLDRNGSPVTICTDRTRVDDLHAAERRERDAARERAKAELTATLIEQVAAIETPGARDLAPLVAVVLSKAAGATGVYRLARELAPDLPAEWPYEHQLAPKHLELLAGLAPTTLVRVALLALGLGELRWMHDDNRRRVEWYVGIADADIATTDTDAAEAVCGVCGEPVDPEDCARLVTDDAPLLVCDDCAEVVEEEEESGALATVDQAWDRAWAEYEAWKAQPQTDELEDGGAE